MLKAVKRPPEVWKNHPSGLKDHFKLHQAYLTEDKQGFFQSVLMSFPSFFGMSGLLI